MKKMFVLLLILLLCGFNVLIMKTRLGQKFRAVGQSQTVANASGINVDRVRLIAIMISTVLAGWGQLLFIQSDGMGTLTTYSAHEQVGLQSLGRGIEEDCFSAGVHVVHVVEEAWCASSA